MDSGYKLAGVFGSIVGVAALLVATAGLAGGGSGAAAPEGSSTSGAKTVSVELGDLFIKPASLTVAPGSDVTIEVKNTGGIDHDLTIKGGATTGALKPGTSKTWHVGKVSAALDLLCSIPGHAEAGMRASLVVNASASSDTHAGHTGMTPEEMDKSYMAGVTAYPAKTQGQGNQPMTPQVQNGVKVFELTAAETDWEVAPGDVRKAMAYNGQVPGPFIRVNLGDRVRIVLNNKLKESTAMHFHGQQVPNAVDGVPGLTQPLVLPGASYTYEFTVRNTGSHMYHSHMNGAVQIPSGLLGAFVVDGPQDQPAAHEELMILNDGPLGYTLNGKGFPATQPIVAKLGEQVRIRYMNEGLQIHPMHLHGLVQTVVAKDGFPLPQPFRADTVLVAPGERVDVLVEATDAGLWAFHCHILTHAESEAGMFGMVTVFIVK